MVGIHLALEKGGGRCSSSNIADLESGAECALGGLVYDTTLCASKRMFI